MTLSTRFCLVPFPTPERRAVCTRSENGIIFNRTGSCRYYLQYSPTRRMKLPEYPGPPYPWALAKLQEHKSDEPG